MTTRLSGVQRLAHEERGLALVLALLVVAAMSISTVALVGLVSSNETAFGRDRQEVRALNIGQSGLNYGVSYMQQYLAANDSTNGLAVGSTVGSSGTPMYSGAVDGGTMSWYATKTGSATWTIYANAVSPNGAVTRRLSLNMGGNVTDPDDHPHRLPGLRLRLRDGRPERRLRVADSASERRRFDRQLGSADRPHLHRELAVHFGRGSR